MNERYIAPKNHVLVIVQNCPIESDRRVEREIFELRDAGYKISLICPSSPVGVPRKQIDGIDIYRFSYTIAGNGLWSYIAEYTESLAKILLLALKIHARSPIDVVQTCNPPDLLFIAGTVFKLLGARFVFDQHDPAPEIYCSRISKPRMAIYWILRLFERLSFLAADAIIVTNESAKCLALDRSGCKRSKVNIVRNGPSIRPSTGGICDEGLKDSHRFMVCCMGVMAPQDGGDYLINVADHVVNKMGRKDVLFTIVGGGSALEAMKSQARDKRLSDHVHFAGWIYDMQLLQKYLATADVCISPEPGSACNKLMTFIKVLDYMAAGKPIVAFDLPETRFSAEDAALYAMPNDIGDFAGKVIELLNNEQLRSRMGETGRGRLHNRGLLWGNSRPVYLRIYAELAKSAEDKQLTFSRDDKRHSPGMGSIAYYLLKPMLPRSLQRSLRRKVCDVRLRRHSQRWPIDLEAGNKPLNWSGWPKGKQFALVLTHDVETAIGQSKCLRLAGVEEQFGLRSSFGFVAKGYQDNVKLRSILRDRGFEVYLHGIYHNGLMYASKSAFRLHARLINKYIRDWKVAGFRSPSMYRNPDWISELDILYDASSFDTDPFEPQPGGLGTIFPLWVQRDPNARGYVELPYTVPQDFTLFIMLGEQSIDIWKRKLDWIAERGGMALFLTHPDYMNFEGRKCGAEEYSANRYMELLEYVKDQYSGRFWNALPEEMARFWKETYIPGRVREAPVGYLQNQAF